MLPSRKSSDPGTDALEKALDQIANTDWRTRVTAGKGDGIAAPVAARERDTEDKRRQPKSQETAKPKQPKGVQYADEADVIGGLEVLDYVRKDGTPGVVIRPKGRRLGMRLAKGDWNLFVAIAMTFRNGETMNALSARVKPRIT